MAIVIRTDQDPIQCVYVAGKLSATPPGRGEPAKSRGDVVVEYLSNCRVMNQHAYELLQLGYAPFDPALDFLFSMACGPMTIQDYYQYSLNQMERQDAIIVDPDGFEQSGGTQKEVERAKEIGMPVFMGKTWAESVQLLETEAHGRLAPGSDFAAELSTLTEIASRSIARILLSEDRMTNHPAWSWQDETPEEHIGAAIGHLNTHRRIRDGHQDQTDEYLLDNALTRAIMALGTEATEE